MNPNSARSGTQKLDHHYELLRYLAEQTPAQGGRLPAIHELARDLAVSPAKLREQLEVARAFGLVEVRPKTGIRRLDYSFRTSLRPSIRYALSVNPGYFEQIGELRNQIEVAFWYQAVRRLQPEDKETLGRLVDHAWAKLRGNPVQIPHDEHRELHLTIYHRLENEFVRGLLETYWDAYEAVGLNVYADLAYLRMVWTYHQKMVEAIASGDLEAGYRVLVEHAGLLHDRPELDHFHRTGSDPSGQDSSMAERSLAR
jgi:DNA-binding FadR family transcriptional regulator